MRWLIFLCLISCTDFLDTWDAYEIKKGNHYSQRSGLPPRVVSLRSGNYMQFKARFTTSCLYIPYYDDINKLYGFTDCNSLVHQNSARIGWRHKDGVIEIFAYWYVDGKRGFKKLGETTIYTADTYSILIDDNNMVFTFNTTTHVVPRSKSCERGVRARLYPYFGGNEPAPQDIKIYIYEMS